MRIVFAYESKTIHLLFIYWAEGKTFEVEGSASSIALRPNIASEARSDDERTRIKYLAKQVRLPDVCHVWERKSWMEIFHHSEHPISTTYGKFPSTSLSRVSRLSVGGTMSVAIETGSVYRVDAESKRKINNCWHRFASITAFKIFNKEESCTPIKYNETSSHLSQMIEVSFVCHQIRCWPVLQLSDFTQRPYGVIEALPVGDTVHEQHCIGPLNLIDRQSILVVNWNVNYLDVEQTAL